MCNVDYILKILTVVALIFAIYQTWLAWRVQREAAVHAKKLRQIEDALTTSYRGEFPGFIGEIACLLERAESSLDLFYDIPGYGELSDPQGWLAMRHAIERKVASGLTVTTTLYSSTYRREILKEQILHKGDQWNVWIKSTEVAQKFNNYFARHGYKDQVESLTSQRYVEISMEVQEKILREVFGHLEVVLVNELIPLYFWLIDNREAIFAIPSFSENSSEFGFYTSDARIIKALNDMRARYVKRAEPLEDVVKHNK